MNKMRAYEIFILEDLESKRGLITDDPFFIMDRVGRYNFGYLYHCEGGIKQKFDPDYYEFESFISSVEKQEIQKIFDLLATENRMIVENYIKSYALNKDPIRYDILTRLKDSDAIFEYILAQANAALLVEIDFPFDRDALHALASCYNWKPWMQKQVIQFYSEAYDVTRNAAIERDEDDELLYSDIYLVLTRAIFTLPTEEITNLKEQIVQAYGHLAKEDMGYHGNQTSGYIALMLTEIGDLPQALELIKGCIEVTGKHYQTNKFVYQNRYAYWYLTQEPEAALAHFNSANADEPLEYLVALFADLDYKNATVSIEKKLTEVDDPVNKEAFKEGLVRLNNQLGQPAKADRMIWLFESTSPSERALGDDNNSVFVKRAQEAHNVDTNVYETDDE